ncbi:flagellar protein FliT [Methylocucumis oryzae]|uniref:flagellar protein FliT n=1 Tax=Methylocucumis oryzae TaxID=1632867 RepID=UPI0012FEC8D5|nr:flagellar protein FliT [Methylocucumis oryzae]
MRALALLGDWEQVIAVEQQRTERLTLLLNTLPQQSAEFAVLINNLPNLLALDKEIIQLSIAKHQELALELKQLNQSHKGVKAYTS